MFVPAKRTKGNGVDRVGRKFQILTMLYTERYESPAVARAYGDEGWRTPYQIARAVGMKPSKHFYGILNELYADGVLLMKTEEYRSNQYKSLWCIASNARWTEPYKAWFDAYFERRNMEAFTQQLELPLVSE